MLAVICDHCLAEIAGTAAPPDPAVFPRPRTVLRDDGSLARMKQAQWRVIEILWTRQARYVRAETIFALGRHREDSGDADHIVRVEIARTRAVLAGTPYQIVTLWGAGYRLARRERLAAEGAHPGNKRAAIA